LTLSLFYWLVIATATAGASRRALRGCLADGLYTIITLYYLLLIAH